MDAQARAIVAAPETPAARLNRLSSIDLLRGLVIALMALDHTRDFFGASGQSPRDVAEPASNVQVARDCPSDPQFSRNRPHVRVASQRNLC
jgi:uncharacterized membrane protein